MRLTLGQNLALILLVHVHKSQYDRTKGVTEMDETAPKNQKASSRGETRKWRKVSEATFLIEMSKGTEVAIVFWYPLAKPEELPIPPPLEPRDIEASSVGRKRNPKPPEPQKTPSTPVETEKKVFFKKALTAAS